MKLRFAPGLLLFATAFVALAPACGGGEESLFPDGDSDGGRSGDGGGTFPGDDDAGFVDIDPGECASQVLCGANATCCAAGQECVGSACVAACESGVRCGEACCPGGQVCLNTACVAPGAACQDSFDCGEDEFCEPTVNRCLPQPSDENLCVVRPPTPTFAPELKWKWDTPTIKPDYNRIFSLPIVIDLDGDTFPEVVVITGAQNTSSETNLAYLRALDGRTGVEKWAAEADVFKDTYAVNMRSTPAAGNIDGDAANTIEIVVPARNGGLLAFNGADGSFRWRSTMSNGTSPYPATGETRRLDSAAVALADMDGDGKAEIVVGGLIFDDLGRLTRNPTAGEDREHWGSSKNHEGANTYGAISIVADVDDDPNAHDQYVLTGNRAIRRDGTIFWDQSATATPPVATPLIDGYPAIADLDKDGIPELVVTYGTRTAGPPVVKSAFIRVMNARTGAVIDTLAVPGEGYGGPPTIADFDGDGFMEIASANGSMYNVFEYDVETKKLSVKWSKPTQDVSSNVTGSSVFDFEGDGAAEVVYNDECYARVYKGTNGDELFAIPNSTGTIHEYPVIADVNGDNRSEFVVVANDFGSAGTCPGFPAGGKRWGVYVYGDPNNKWVRTRRIWNQHAYHITNIESNGRIPSPEPISWGPQGLNNYRVSSQGKGVFNAPDLSVDLEVSTQPCPAGIELRARVKNGGSLGVPAGVTVTFHAGTNAQGPVLGQGATTKPLLPGESEVVRLVVPKAQGAQAYFVLVDGSAVDASAPNGIVDECLEDNNSATVGGVQCPTPK